MKPDVRLVFRVVSGFWLAAWYCNAATNPGFGRNFVDAQSYALDIPGFPALLTSAPLGMANYFAPALVLVALVWPCKSLARAATGLMTCCALFACLHLETCNDATFVTALWTSLWLNWLVYNGDRDDAAFYAVGRGLAHAVIGMLFLGGMIGKLTDEYRSGEAFYRLYFRDNQAWPYPELRAKLSQPEFRQLATWFSRASIWAETMLALAPILPTQFVLGLGTLTILTMMTSWTFQLFSVLGSLLGLMIGAEILRRREAALAS